jgi:hypothetical protein
MPYEPVALPQSTAAEAMRSATLPLYAYDFALDDHSVHSALAHYRHDRSRKAAGSWPLRRNIGHGIYKRVLLPIVRSRPLARLRGHVDERRMDGAAEALRQAAAGRSFLSSDGCWQRAVDELTFRLETTLRAHAAG